MHTTPTHSDTAFFLGPAATEVTALLLAAAIVADACHTQQKRKPKKKETKKDVVYKFPSIRPKPFPMLRFLFCLKRVGGGGGCALVDWVWPGFSDVDIERRTPYPSVEKNKKKRKENNERI
jgi:hypothetical protein